MTWEDWVLSQVIVCVAFAVRGLVGFGATLVMTPLLALFLEMKKTVVLTAIVSIVSGVGLVYHARKDIARRTFLLISISALVGLALGTYLLVTQPSGLLKRLVGALTVLFAVRLFQRGAKGSESLRIWPESAGAVAGLIAGALGGLFGTSGPPLVVYLSRRGIGMAAFRATLIACFTVLDVSRLFGYAASGLLPSQTLLTGVLLIPASLLGAYIGTVLHIRSSQRFLRAAVGVVLVVTGALLAIGH